MRRPSAEFRDLASDALADPHRLLRLRRLRLFHNAQSLAQARHIAEAIVRMTDEELDRLRDHLLPFDDDAVTGGYSYAHPPPEWMDAITRDLLGVPAKVTGAQA